MVKAADELAEFVGWAFLDAAGVVPGGDGLHGVGKGLDGLGDLAGKIEGEPRGGEESQARHHSEDEEIEAAELTAGAVEGPVGVGRRPHAGHGGGEAVGEREASDDGSSAFDACGTKGVIGLADGEDRLAGALGGGEDGRGDGLAGDGVGLLRRG